MALADQIPTMDDAGLANLKVNALRLQASGAAKQQEQAQAILPVIEEELARRLALKPPKAKPKPRAKKAPIAAVDADAA